MSSIIIQTDPMAALREAAKHEINRRFNREATECAHRDAAYAAKRLLAARVIDGETVEQLDIEAAQRGMTVQDLARDIVSKPDTVAEREMRRQALLARIRAAETPQQLQTVTAQHG